jgi:hypothetical protein
LWQDTNVSEGHAASIFRVKWYEIFTAVKIQIVVFGVVTACSVVAGHQSFGGPCCLHPQGEVISGFHSAEDSNRGLLGYDAV